MNRTNDARRAYFRVRQRHHRRNTSAFNWLLRTTTRSGNPRRGEVDSRTGSVRWYAGPVRSDRQNSREDFTEPRQCKRVIGTVGIARSVPA